jgi:hypothetical protein
MVWWPRLGRLRQEDPDFKVSLGYIVRAPFSFKKKKKELSLLII